MVSQGIRRSATCLAVAMIGYVLAPLAAFAQTRVPAGAKVMLAFSQTVSTKTAKKGDVIALRVYSDVVVDGKTVIRQDAPARGVVESVRKPGRFGKRGELKVRLTEVTDVTGARVPLEPYKSGERFKAEGPAASGAGLLILGPIGLVGGAFVKGSHITIAKGTRIEAAVKGDTDVNDATR